MKKTKGRTVFTIILIVLCAALAIAIAVTIYNKMNPAPQEVRRAAAAPAEATAVRVQPVVLGDVRNSVVINGEVLAGTQVSANPTVAGRLTDLNVKIGDSVRAGQLIAYVDPSRPGEVYSKSPVVAAIAGTVLSTPANIGDSVSAQTAIVTIGDLSSIVLETYVPERFSTDLRIGLTAEVGLQAISDERFAAQVYEVSPVLDPVSRTTRIRLRFPNRDNRIKAGMFATVYLVTKEANNVSIIPRSALINTAGTWICYVANDQSIAERRELTLGLESEDTVEIVQGIIPGEMIVVLGQNFLSDQEPVRIVE
jgi:multidrug efflux pump subunit AcrA (membrane-fusion protein)